MGHAREIYCGMSVKRRESCVPHATPPHSLEKTLVAYLMSCEGSCPAPHGSEGRRLRQVALGVAMGMGNGQENGTTPDATATGEFNERNDGVEEIRGRGQSQSGPKWCCDDEMDKE